MQAALGLILRQAKDGGAIHGLADVTPVNLIAITLSKALIVVDFPATDRTVTIIKHYCFGHDLNTSYRAGWIMVSRKGLVRAEEVEPSTPAV